MGVTQLIACCQVTSELSSHFAKTMPMICFVAKCSGIEAYLHRIFQLARRIPVYLHSGLGFLKPTF